MEALENGTGDKTESSTQMEIVTPTVWGQLSLVRIHLIWGWLRPTTSLPGMVQSSPGTITHPSSSLLHIAPLSPTVVSSVLGGHGK